MKTNKAIQLLRYWEMVFLLITGLMLTSIWASAETTNDVVSSDTRNSEAAANFDGKPDLEEAETRRYHRILALVEYSQGDREAALKHLRAAGELEQEHFKKEGGLGIKIIRERLNRIYGDQATFNIESIEGRVRVRIEIMER